MTYTLNIRPKRQVTLPQGVLDSLGLEIGDEIAIDINKDQITIKPQKKIALNALQAIQNAFSQASIPEADLQTELKTQRQAKA